MKKVRFYKTIYNAMSAAREGVRDGFETTVRRVVVINEEFYEVSFVEIEQLEVEKADNSIWF